MAVSAAVSLSSSLGSSLPSASAAGRYLHWGVIQISLTNLLIIIGMVVLFGLALVLPFPGGDQSEPTEAPSQSGPRS